MDVPLVKSYKKTQHALNLKYACDSLSLEAQMVLMIHDTTVYAFTDRFHTQFYTGYGLLKAGVLCFVYIS